MPGRRVKLVLTEEEKLERRRGQLKDAQGRFRRRLRREAEGLRERSTLQAEVIVAIRMEIEALRMQLSCHEDDSVVPRTPLPDPAWLAPPPPPKPRRQRRGAPAKEDKEDKEDSDFDSSSDFSSDAGSAVGAASERTSSHQAGPLAGGQTQAEQGQWTYVNQWRDAIVNQPPAPSFGAIGQPAILQPPLRRESQPLPGNHYTDLPRPVFERNGISVPNLRLGSSAFHTPEMAQSAQLSAATTPTWTSSGSGRREDRTVTKRTSTGLELAIRRAAAEAGERAVADPKWSSQECAARGSRRDRAATTTSAPAPTASTAALPMLGNDSFAFRSASVGNLNMMANTPGWGINEANGAGPSSQPYYNANGAGHAHQPYRQSINEANGVGPSSQPLPTHSYSQWGFQPSSSSAMPQQDESSPPYALPASNGNYGLVAPAEGLNSTLSTPPNRTEAFAGLQLSFDSEQQQEQDRQTDAALAKALSLDAAVFPSSSVQFPDSL